MAKWTMRRTDPNSVPDCSLVCDSGNGVEIHIDWCEGDAEPWLVTEWREGHFWLPSTKQFREFRDAMAEAERLCGEVVP